MRSPPAAGLRKSAEQATRSSLSGIPERKLALVQDGEVRRVFSVAVGTTFVLISSLASSWPFDTYRYLG